MKPLNGGINFLLSFIFMMLLTFNQISLVTSSTLLNSTYYFKIFDQVSYYDDLGNEIKSGLINLGLATGLPKDVFENSIDRDWLEIQGNNYIDSLMNYLSSKSDTFSYEFNGKLLETKLNEIIGNYAKKSGMPITKEAQTSINEMLVNNVKRQITVVDPRKILFPSIRSFTTIIVKDKFYFMLANMLILISLYFINKKEPRKFLLWLSYCFISSGLFIFIPSFLLRSSSILERLALSNTYLKEVVTVLLERYVSYILYTGLATTIVGVLLVAIVYGKLYHTRKISES